MKTWKTYITETVTGDFYPTFTWSFLSHFKKCFVLLEKDCFDHVVLGRNFLFSMWLPEDCIISILLYKISELHKGAKRLQCNSDFMNKIEERSNTAFFQPNRLSDGSPDEIWKHLSPAQRFDNLKISDCLYQK